MELLPAHCYNNSLSVFKKQLNTSTKTINKKLSIIDEFTCLGKYEMNQQKLKVVNQECVVLCKLSRKELEKIRELTNEAFLQIMADRSKKIHNIIHNKENEIKELHEKLKRFLCSSQNILYDLRSYDQELKKAEMDTRRCRERIENFEVPELIKKEYIEKTIGRFSKKMDNIENKVKLKVQDNDDNLKEVFEEAISRTEEQYEDIIFDLIDNVKNRYEDILESTENRYQDRQKYLEEAYERQIKLMNDKINEFI